LRSFYIDLYLHVGTDRAETCVRRFKFIWCNTFLFIVNKRWKLHSHYPIWRSKCAMEMKGGIELRDSQLVHRCEPTSHRSMSSVNYANSQCVSRYAICAENTRVPCLATPDIQLAKRGLTSFASAVAPIGKASRAARTEIIRSDAE